MHDVDFSICPLIKEELSFLTYYDFCKNAKILKAYYDALDKDAKIFYKWYCYSNIHMDEKYKNYIWNYLNTDEPQAYVDLIANLNKYRVK